ncbi:flavin reductase family protein [Novosphingobium sp. 9]|uniref:flavin reductase family protein n=1 Tax=Novosphingobium sp. 9 TaxID=2025349 RepID=UPI0021B58B6E|nr:flavin reductase family protein [Novosphingobium sp. 9]
MEFDFTQMAGPDRYKLLASSVTPRPIAWITTQTADGRRNCAPFSFFNAMGGNPPLLVVGMMRRPDGTHKDTPANILETGEFVVHLVSEAMAGAMNLTCIDAPPEYDEIDMAGLATAPSSVVAPPRLIDAPVAMECRLFQTVEAGTVTIALGEVQRFHIKDHLIDAEKLYVDTLGLNLVARMHGGGWYSRQTDLFSMDRPSFADWQARHEVPPS